MLNPSGLISGVHRREHLRRPPRPPGHPRSRTGRSRASPSRPSCHHRRRSRHRGHEGDLTRSGPLHRRGDVRLRHRSGGLGGQLGRRPGDPVPGPKTLDDRGRVRQGRPRPGRPLQGLGGARLIGASRAFDERPCPTSAATSSGRTVDIFDTTLRDGAQFEGISLTVEDKLRVAEQLDWLRWPGSRAATRRPTPRTPSSSRRATEPKRPPRALVAFGPTRRPAGRVDEDPTLVSAGRRRHVDGLHRWQVVGLPTSPRRSGTTLDEGVAMVGESVRFLRTPACGCSSTPSTSSTATRPTPSSPCGAPRPPPPAAARCWCSATPTAGRCPRGAAHHRRGHLVLRVGPPSSTPRTTRAAWWPTQIAAVSAGPARAGDRQRLRRADRQRQPDDRHPDLTSSSASPRCPTAAWTASLRCPPRRRAGQPAAAPRRPLAGSRRSPTRADCTPRRWARSAGPAEHIDPPVGNRTRVLVSGPGRPGRDGHEGR